MACMKKNECWNISTEKRIMWYLLRISSAYNLDEETYNAHVLRKEKARAEKSKDEKINDADVFTMDLQAVLLA